MRINPQPTNSFGNGFGNRYEITDDDKQMIISIIRNYSLDFPTQEDRQDRYFIKIGYGTGIALSDEQMLEFFAAYLALKETYENGTD